ncbi:hypothetical protein ACIBEJ_51460 [Nonomuraea sp. NPDC050790]|uniref:hypothetical protein n=1 Tax=Nonomuraea sp. NPDC050790 TaxID=3364371 RepID=UPI00379CEA8E
MKRLITILTCAALLAVAPAAHASSAYSWECSRGYTCIFENDRGSWPRYSISNTRCGLTRFSSAWQDKASSIRTTSKGVSLRSIWPTVWEVVRVPAWTYYEIPWNEDDKADGVFIFC